MHVLNRNYVADLEQRNYLSKQETESDKPDTLGEHRGMRM